MGQTERAHVNTEPARAASVDSARLPSALGERALWLIFFASGAAGLGYEIAWTRMLSVGLGHEMPSMLAVVAAFFGGVSLGAWGFDRVVSRSPSPSRWYAGFETCIGLWGVASMAWIPYVNLSTPVWIGIDPSPLRHWTVAFVVPFVTLLPATVSMGATFPAFERIAARAGRSGRALPGLYAANTAGAIAGVVVTTSFLFERFGYAATLAILAALNAVSAAAVVVTRFADGNDREPPALTFADAPSSWMLDVSLLASGILSIGFQVICVAVLARATENTVYSFAAALIVFLAGTAAGAAVHHRHGARWSFLSALRWTLLSLGLASFASIVILGESREIEEALRRSSSGGLHDAIVGELVLASTALLVPAMLMGFAFSQLMVGARRKLGGVGRALGLNTLGCAIAPLLFGVGLLPAVGAKWALFGIGTAYLAWMFALAPFKPREYALAGAGAFLCLSVSDDLWLVRREQREKLRVFREGSMGAVSVVEEQPSDRKLHVNNRFIMGGTGRGFVERRMAFIPLLLHPAPRRSLFLGLGAGTTVGQAATYPELHVAAAELLPEVVEVLPEFRDGHHLDAAPNVAIHVADARRFVRASEQRYDVIVADLFHPARDGAGLLYTREHYGAVSAKLSDGGLFAQWLPLYQMSLETLRIITRTFVHVFPHTSAYLAHFNVESPVLGLVGSRQPLAHTSHWYEDSRRSGAFWEGAIAPLALAREIDLFGCVVADDVWLRRWVDGAPLNTDDHPLLVFTAPRFLYDPAQSRHAVLQHLLSAWAPSHETLRGALPRDDGPFAERVVRYANARTLYLRGELARYGAEHPRESLELLLDAVQASPEFRTAYVKAMQIAVELRGSDPATSLDILQKLTAVAPWDPSAAEALRQLFP
jgi:spermidine synthase